MVEINPDRFLETLKHQGSIGWKKGEGLFREAYSKEYFEVRDYLEKKMQESGLETRIDSVGNLFGRLEGEDPSAPAILTGSHLDAVKAGGILDGALGVVAGIEALVAIKESGYIPKHSMEVVGFVAEEGGPLGGTFGSRAFSNQMKALPPDEVLEKYSLSKDDIDKAKANPKDYCAYLELHIEQGPILWQKEISIGIPTAIVGITRYKGRIKGASNHAGTTPMKDRKDAFYETVVVLHKWLDFMREQENIVCNVGTIELEPGQISIVPEDVRFGIEIRSTDTEIIQVAVEYLKKLFSEIKTCHGILEPWVEKPPVRLNKNIINVIEKVSQKLEYKSLQMPSWASHDASPIAHVIPTGMIFVPSVNGISHHRDEFTEEEDLIKGAIVLVNSLLKLDLTIRNFK